MNERRKFWALFAGTLFLIVLAGGLFPTTGRCFYFSQHATDC